MAHRSAVVIALLLTPPYFNSFNVGGLVADGLASSFFRLDCLFLETKVFFEGSITLIPVEEVK